MRETFHLIQRAVWAAGDPAAPLTRDSLADEGFIHCTDGVEALIATAERHYRDDPRAFLALTIDLDRVGSPWRFDEPGKPYPHVYGPIDRTAIVAVAPVKRAADGRFLGLDDR
jgi:uncharacterized protein (DUF952 family)